MLLVRELERARGDVAVHPDVDVFFTATFFLLGIYGVLTTTHSPSARAILLTGLITTAMHGLVAR